MGVHGKLSSVALLSEPHRLKGLWEVIRPVARPIALETLGNKKLAIDSSIWLYQFQLAIRDKEGRALDNAHILGFLRRITKLLFYGIKPVFVFDGGAPTIKRVTISERKKRKRGGQENLAKTAEKLLAAQMRQQAVKEVQRRQLVDETGDLIDDDDVFMDDRVSTVQARGAPLNSRAGRGEDGEPLAKKKKYVHRDQYALPEMDESIQAKATLQDPRMATEEELREFIDEIKPEDFDVDGEWFSNLSTELKYEIIGDLRIKSRQPSKNRVDLMQKSSATPLDFSKAQIKFLMQRNDLTQKLLGVTDDISNAHIQIPVRIASERNKHYVLVRNDDANGGGWALGVREEASKGKTKRSPIKIDNTTTESDTDKASNTSEGEFEAVDIPSAVKQSSSPDSGFRKQQAVAALQRRYERSQPQPEEQGVPTLTQQMPLFHGNEVSNVDLPESVLYASEADPELMRDIMTAVEQAPPQSASMSRSSSAYANSTAPQRAGASSFQQPSISSSNQFLSSIPATSFSAFQASTNKSKRHNIPPQQNTSDSDDDFEQVDIPSAPIYPNIPTQASNVKQQPTTQIDLTLGLVQRDFAETSTTSPAKPPPVGPIASAGPPSPSIALHGVSDAIAMPSPPLQSSFSATRPSLLSRRTSSSSQASTRSRMESGQSTSRRPSHSPPVSRSSSLFSRPSMVDDVKRTSKGKATDMRSIDPIVTSPSALPSPETESVRPSNAGIQEVAARSVRSEASQSFSPQHAHSSRPTPLLSRTLSSESSQQMQPMSASSSAPASSRPLDSDVPADLVPEDFPLADIGHELDENEIDAGDLEEAELQANLQREEGHFSKFLHDLHNRNLDEMRHEVEEEMRVLQAQRVVDRRNADDITAQMSKEIQAMLRLFGLPYIIAPMEAEAQCAELISKSLVDGIITDDSDVFLFGGTRVYKNMFNQNKYVECYLLSDMERELNLTRDKLIQLAHFLGSDYVDGLVGVGPVIGMELMTEFPGANGLTDFRKWWQLVQTGKDSSRDTGTPFRRRFKKSKKKLFLDEHWPNPEVAKAYYHPTVDESEERFVWGIPDLDGLRGFLSETLGWGTHKVDDLLEPLIKRMSQRLHGVANMQGTLDKFFDVTGGSGRFEAKTASKPQSQRMQNVIKTWKNAARKLAADDDISEEEVPARPAQKRPRVSRKQSSRSTTSQSVVQSPAEEGVPKAGPSRRKSSQANVSVPDTEDESDVERPPPKRKVKRTAKANTKVPVAPNARKLGQARKKNERRQLEFNSDDSGFE